MSRRARWWSAQGLAPRRRGGPWSLERCCGVVAALVLLGCGAGPRPPALDTGGLADDAAGAACGELASAALELGLGEQVYRAVRDDKAARCDMVAGPQGGHHSFFAIQVRGIDPTQTWTLELEAEHDGQLVGQSTSLPGLRCLDPDHPMTYVGIPLFWGQELPAVPELPVEVHAVLDSEAGPALRTTASVLLVLPAERHGR
jgi:hypothetical protein